MRHSSMPAAPPAINNPRLVAAGIIRRHNGRTIRLTATSAGVTGSVRPAVAR